MLKQHSLFRTWRFVDLLEQVLDVTLDALMVHRGQDRLHCLRLCELVELMTPVHTRQLEDQRKAERGVVLDDRLDMVCLVIQDQYAAPS